MKLMSILYSRYLLSVSFGRDPGGLYHRDMSLRDPPVGAMSRGAGHPPVQGMAFGSEYCRGVPCHYNGV